VTLAPSGAPATIVRVALDAPVDTLFDYLAPGATVADIGRRVRVPFGRGERTGVVVDVTGASELAPERLRTVRFIDRTLPALPADLIELTRFAADYYRHPLGPSLIAVLPPALKRATFRPPPAAAWRLTPAGVEHARTLPARAHAQRRLAERLASGPCPAGLLAGQGALLRDWARRGLVEAAILAADPAVGQANLALNPDQVAAVAAVREAPPGFSAWLLFGITGSGKTEVYLELIAGVLAAGMQCLMLAPEIHLTPQLGERLRQRFPGRHVVSLHSGMSDGERLAAWLDGLSGRADLVLGTRLAVFAPLPRLGLILVDEEHDPSYKQMDGLRYSARDVAVWRARQRGVAIVLGSATPALETWRNAASGRYRRLDLPRRAHAEAALPGIRLIDTRVDRPVRGLSAALDRALADCLARGEQALVFVNRRGYAPTLYCQGCGHVSRCPRCSANLILHRRGSGHELRCHHCGLESHPPETCPNCGGLDLRPLGQGTQRIEETLAERFPSARILRIDRDTTRRKGAFAEMRAAIAAREVDILVGTQIVAKGHDFPRLTLVGVLGADQALMAADFRAGERLFAQLMQVAGRAGRAEHVGEVWIQTDFPRHPLFDAVCRHDYLAWAEAALAERRAAGFPPFVHQALLRAEADRLEVALTFLDHARRRAEPLAAGIDLFDPVPALLTRLADRERAQLLVQSTSRARLQGFLAPWLANLRALPARRELRWSVDVDPLEF